jgi:hypothetical protein
MAASAPMPYGRTEAEWETLTHEGLKFLVERAQMARTTSYTELDIALSRRTGLRRFDFALELDRAAMGRLLGLIVERERPESGHMISSIVIYLDENDAGSGFYRLAQGYGLLRPNASSDDRLAFWSGEVTAIHQHYKRAH